ncbi:MAG TPA: peroxidase-related enzyme, partial [Gemmatimonadales bacterium]|nr:peroxidase-related enzyme [Gemmatimonadales bacterium]
EATGPVREMYDQTAAQWGFVPNWVQAFSERPGVRAGWLSLLNAIKANLPQRTYELATLAAARALRNSYCVLAHGRVLAEQVFDAETVAAIIENREPTPLEPRERAMMAFVERVVREADRISERDIATLRGHGYSDAEIFDIAAAASARCFFAKLLDALGVEADASFNKLAPVFRDAAIVGRPMAQAAAG